MVLPAHTLHGLPSGKRFPAAGDGTDALIHLTGAQVLAVATGVEGAGDARGGHVGSSREDLLGQAHPLCPSVFDFKVLAEHGSMYNTPPTYAIYIAGLVFQWLKREGGLAEMAARNIAKAKLLYDFLDGNPFYTTRVDPACRSRMNVPFLLRDEALNATFLAEAEAAGLMQLKGHKSVGGMRASIYNAMPLAGVQALVDFMAGFARRHG